MDWVKKEFNIQNIETATDKAVLITEVLHFNFC